jgi:hypothetical protein
MPWQRQRLVHLIIGKSVIEALLVTAIAVAFYLATTNTHLQGWLDQADAKTISGWVVDGSQPQARVELQLFVDGAFVESRRAADFRPDVHSANRAPDDWHGFVFATPTLLVGEHEARVYAVYHSTTPSRITLQLIGKPLRFRTASATER